METNTPMLPSSTSSTALDGPLPMRNFDVLYHVGTFNPSDKGCVSQSLEGNGLSVSVHPEEWSHIARLGGSPTWSLTKEGNCFVDVWELTGDQRAEIYCWATDNQLTVPQPLWEVTFPHEDGTGSFLFGDEQDARDEHSLQCDIDPSVTIRETEGLTATNMLRARMGHSCPPGVVEDFAIFAYSTDVVGADGAWWNDTYAPGELSCPRGAIAPSRVETFTVTRCTARTG